MSHQLAAWQAAPYCLWRTSVSWGFPQQRLPGSTVRGASSPLLWGLQGGPRDVPTGNRSRDGGCFPPAGTWGLGEPLWCPEEAVAAGSGPVWQLCSWAWRGRSSSGTWRGRGAVTPVAEGRTETDYKPCARSFPLKAHDSGCRSFPSLSWDPPEIIETLRMCSWMFSEIRGWEGVMSVLPGASAGRRASACSTRALISPGWGRMGRFHTVISHAGGWAPQAKPTLLYVVEKLGL